MTVRSADRRLTELDRWVRHLVEAELRRLVRRAPRLAGAAERQVGRSLTSLGERLLLSPARDWASRFPERRGEITALLPDARRHR